MKLANSARQSALIRWFNGAGMRRLTHRQLLEKLIGFDTTSHRSNVDCVAFIAEYLEGHGITPHIVEGTDDAGTPKSGLYCLVGPDDKPATLLSAHTDVVPALEEGWSSDPFTLREDGGRFYGRGSTDMKGFIAISIEAICNISEPLTAPVGLMLSYDEEVGCLGIPWVLQHYLQHYPKPKMAIIGEPTNMRIGLAHKGKVVFSLIVTGKSGHSAQVSRGINAVDAAAQVITRLKAHFADALEDEADIEYDESYLEQKSTISIAQITGGSEAINIIPDRCEILAELRYRPQTDPLALLQDITQRIRDDIEPSMRITMRQPDGECAEHRVGIELVIHSSYVALPSQRDSIAATIAARALPEPQMTHLDFGTEAGTFSQRDIPAVVCGPGCISRAHRPDEYILETELQAGARFIASLIQAHI